MLVYFSQRNAKSPTAEQLVFEISESYLWDGRTVVHSAVSIAYLHGKVGDEGCSWDLHLKHTFTCLRSAVHHCA